MANVKVCDCGHPPTNPPKPGESGGTGYARTKDGRTLCYSCADAQQLADFLYSDKAGTFGAYLSGDGRTVTTWTGGKLARVTREWTTREGFGGRTTRVEVRDSNGRRWYGRGPGRNMYVRLRRYKVKGGA